VSSNKYDFLKRINEDFLTLYVEDNELVRQQTLKMLKKLLPNVICATNGKEGVQEYLNHNVENESKQIDLIITDIQMPEQDGLGMIRDIRENDKKLPIIIFSAHDNSEYFLEAIKLGIDGYILKPYPMEQIVEVLRDVITKHYDILNLIQLDNNYTWDKDSAELKKESETINLTKNEHKLIEFLLSNKESIKSIDAIEDYIFEDFESNDRRIRNIITRLHNKLNANIIDSVYGRGYKIITVQ